MVMTEEMIDEKLNQNLFATLVTANKTAFFSRSMLFGYSKGNGIFFLTHKGTDKLADIACNPTGLVHVAQIETELSLSYDISISGTFGICGESSNLYQEGIQSLGKKNPQLLAMLNSAAKNDYELIHFKINEIRGWTYYQIIGGMPKTIVKIAE